MSYIRVTNELSSVTNTRSALLAEQYEAAHDEFVRLVESLVNMRSKHHSTEWSSLPEHIADACVRVLGVAGTDIAALRGRTRQIQQRA